MWFAILVLASRSFAQETRDLGFESGALGEPPTGWYVPTDGWKVELSEQESASGARSMSLFEPGESTAPFGNVMQRLPGSDFAGRHVRLTAKILVVGAGRSQMWLRVDRPGDGRGAFDNMGDRPITPGDWQEATIESEIDPDAEWLNIGFMSFGGATVFIDDVTLVLSKDRVLAQEPSPPRAISEQGLKNLTAAAKMLSYVRFFHPSDQAVGVASWDHFAVDLMERVEPAADSSELAQRLTEAFATIAPTAEVWAGTTEQAPPCAPMPNEVKRVAMWKHFGAGSIAGSSGKQLYESHVEKRSISKLPDGPDAAVILESLGGGVCCRIPIAIPRDDAGTLPRGETPHEWAAGTIRPKLSALNRSTRLAGVALAWGVFQHFYPYFDVLQIDWEAALPAALSKAALDEDETSYCSTLKELIAVLQDGHGSVMNSGLPHRSLLPIAVEWAGKDLVVIGRDASVMDKSNVGDVVVSIDGRATEECYADLSRTISAATEGWRRVRSQWALVSELPTKDPAHVILKRADGRTASVDLPRVMDWPRDELPKRPENGAEIEPGIVYFDLDGAETESLTAVMPTLVAAKAILFDLRGYPGSAAKDLMEHLIDEPSMSARWVVPVVRFPDHEKIEWMDLVRWQLKPREPRLNAWIAFMTDGRAISYAESIMGIVENYKLGEIVGATTAGTNGNVNPFTLPGGYTVSWTGMKVLKHDRSQHHGVGIAPTVPVIPTAKGIAEGRDEVLDEAVRVLRSKLEQETRDK